MNTDNVAREARQWPPQAARAPKAPSPPQELGTPNPRAARVRIPSHPLKLSYLHNEYYQ